MFRFTFLTDDKHVVPLMHALAGKARELEVVPVINAKPAPNGKVRVKHGDWPDVFMAEVRARKVTELDAQRIKSIIADIGGSVASYSHLINRCMSLGMIKRGKKSGTGFLYNVQPEK